jgi:hypothetical protein
MVAGSTHGRGQVKEWMRRAGVGLALFSGLLALAVLLLPLVLVLLMVLFDTTAHGVIVLMGLLLSWLRQFMPGGEGGLVPFRMIAFHPLHVALQSLLHTLPCLAGLALILLNPRPGGWWGWVVLFWAFASAFGGEVVTVVLLPGLVIAAVFALAACRGRESRADRGANL